MTTRVIRAGDDEWPHHMNELGPLDPPDRLHVRGRIIDPARRAVAVVGTRRATVAGIDAAAAVASALAREGWVVVSGMARGIDSAAHHAALDAGGTTIAVLGSGVDVCYPPRNKALYESILRRGTVVSEYPDGTPSARWTFPQRNRIIVGFVHANGPVVVVEGGLKSGALITARYALDGSREVYGFAGSFRNAVAIGPHELFRRGEATLVTSPDHLLEVLEVDGATADDPVASAASAAGLLDDDQKDLLMLMDVVAVAPSRLQAETQLPWKRLSAGLARLEIRGLVTKCLAGYEVTPAGDRARRHLLGD